MALYPCYKVERPERKYKRERRCFVLFCFMEVKNISTISISKIKSLK